MTVTAGFEAGGRTRLPASKRVSAGPDGTFVIEGLPRARHTLWAIHDTYPDAELAGVETGTEDAVVRFRPASSLAGVVVDGAGRPASDFMITVRPKERGPRNLFAPPRQVRNAGGAFAVGRLRADSYTVEAATSRGDRGLIELVLAEGEARTGVRLVLEGSTRLAGRVVHATSGAPIGGADVRLDLTSGAEVARTDAQGAFSLERIPRGGELTIHVAAHGYVSERFPARSPKGDVLPEPVTLKLEPGSTRCPSSLCVVEAIARKGEA